MSSSSWENYFELQLQEAGFTNYVKEYRFAPPRRFRFDFCFVEHRLAIEINGGAYSGGRHTTGAGYTRDMEKMSLAAINGYRVLSATTGQVSNGSLIGWTKEYFKRREEERRDGQV